MAKVQVFVLSLTIALVLEASLQVEASPRFVYGTSRRNLNSNSNVNSNTNSIRHKYRRLADNGDAIIIVDVAKDDIRQKENVNNETIIQASKDEEKTVAATTAAADATKQIAKELVTDLSKTTADAVATAVMRILTDRRKPSKIMIQAAAREAAVAATSRRNANINSNTNINKNSIGRIHRKPARLQSPKYLYNHHDGGLMRYKTVPHMSGPSSLGLIGETEYGLAGLAGDESSSDGGDDEEDDNGRSNEKSSDEDEEAGASNDEEDDDNDEDADVDENDDDDEKAAGGPDDDEDDETPPRASNHNVNINTNINRLTSRRYFRGQRRYKY